MGVFSRQEPPNPDYEEKVAKNSALNPEIALVQIATQTLETMARAFQGRKDVKVPMAERAAFANAIKKAMDALANH